jgi:hypothetical protein
MSAHMVSVHESAVRGQKRTWVLLDGQITAYIVEDKAGGVDIVWADGSLPSRAATVDEGVQLVAMRGDNPCPF